MKKVFMILLAMALVATSMGTSVFAKQSDELTKDDLSKKEISTLVDSVGLTEEEIDELPVDVLKELIELDAVKIAAPGKKYYNLKSETPEVSTRDLTSSDIALNGLAFTITSDRPGCKKIYLYGSFDWLKEPACLLTDMMSIGYPESSHIFLDMNNGQPVGFYSRLNYMEYGVNQSAVSYYPADWETTGVAAEYEIETGMYQMDGSIRQYVYVEDSISGTCNVKIRYGHQILFGSPSVSIYPIGLAVTPSINTETLDYGLVLTY